MAGSRPTAVHFTLIFFVMVSLFLGVITYMTFDEKAKIEADIANLKSQNDKDKGAIQVLDQEKKELITLLGYNYASVGSLNEPNTILHAANQDFNTVAGSLATQPQGRTFREIVLAMRTAINTQQQTATQSNTSATTAQANFQTQVQRQETEVTTAKTGQTKSETDLRAQQQEHQKAIATAQAETAKWQTNYRTVTAELEQERAHLADVEAANEKQRLAHLHTIDTQRRKIAELENNKFDSPDGMVELVDNTTRSVWINRGSLDYLRPAITFSVLVKDNSGAGKSTRDVKARIEVVEVTGPHRSRCRILSDEIARPIASGDPIFSPVYQAGRIQNFAFCGVIDLDGDGKSDRKLLEETLNVNGGRIFLQVDDHGIRQPGDLILDVTVKFLVIGDMPDPAKFPGLDEKAREATNMGEELSKLKKEAADAGVEIIKLDDFLTYMGIRTQRRIYRPGEEAGWQLKSGARSTGVDETIGDRESSGQTSGLFRNRSADRDRR